VWHNITIVTILRHTNIHQPFTTTVFQYTNIHLTGYGAIITSTTITRIWPETSSIIINTTTGQSTTTQQPDSERVTIRSNRISCCFSGGSLGESGDAGRQVSGAMSGSSGGEPGSDGEEMREWSETNGCKRSISSQSGCESRDDLQLTWSLSDGRK
jgi:hypothetical protein